MVTPITLWRAPESAVNARTQHPQAYKSCMKLCEIYPVPAKGSFAWKWRHELANGRVIESKEKFPLYYECVVAALREGYQPQMKCFAPGDRAAARNDV